MTFEEISKFIFETKDFKIIYPADKELGYIDSLNDNLTKYLKTLKEIKDDDIIDKELINSVNLISKAINESIILYLNGSPGKSYNVLIKNFRAIKDSFQKLTKEIDNKILYRVRLSEKDIENRYDLFHIPFNKRELIKTQRYSVSGVPSLYLGSSIYCCWLEMGKPLLTKMNISSFKVLEKINFLDFTYNKERIEQIDNKDLLKAYLTIYPLIMACSYKKEHEDKSFIIEYIIPNLVLQWINENSQDMNINGIMYYSTKENISDYSINFVIPPITKKLIKKNKSKNSKFNLSEPNYCEILANKFNISLPISWQTIEILNGFKFKIGVQSLISRNISNKYEYTKFYLAEEFIKDLEPVEPPKVKKVKLKELKNIVKKVDKGLGLKEEIIKIFMENVKGIIPDTSHYNQKHAGKEGHWLETQMGLAHNGYIEPDLFGYEMKNITTSGKISFGDWSADEYIFLHGRVNGGINSINEEFRITRDKFLGIFGKPNPLRDNRYSWSGEPVPTYYNKTTPFGQKLVIDDNENILIIYNFSQDLRIDKDIIVPRDMRREGLILAIWKRDSIKAKLEAKFNQKGWFTVMKDDKGAYKSIHFGLPINFDTWIELFMDRIVFFDSGMYQGNIRPYSMWRANTNFWHSLITESYS